MGYYLGTKTACEAYNKQVADLIGLEFPYSWSSVIENKYGTQFAILKHDVHTSNDLQEGEALPENWFHDEQL